MDSLCNIGKTVYPIIQIPLFKNLEASDLTATQAEIVTVARFLA
jgi:hypothetical protein